MKLSDLIRDLSLSLALYGDVELPTGTYANAIEAVHAGREAKRAADLASVQDDAPEPGESE